MRRHVGLVLVVLALSSCRHFGQFPPSWSRLEARCTPAWRDALQAVRTEGAACTADAECHRHDPAFLGCDAWANRAWGLDGGRRLALEASCSAVSWVPDCTPAVGACVEGRCTGRALEPPPTCDQAQAALAGRLEASQACREDKDCEVANPGPREWPAAAGWKERYAAEWTAVEASCPEAPFLGPAGGTATRAACVDGRCALAGPDTGAQGRFRRPRETEPGCVGRSLRLPSDLWGIHGKLLVTFSVSARGVPSRFRVTGANSRRLVEAVLTAISGCTFEPGTKDGRPISVWMVLPLHFVSG
jgi:hypothetical protein